jgi:hypothetical protein
VLVADGDGQGIRGVGRLRDLGQPEEHLNHALDLVLLGLAEARHGFLHLQGRVFVDLDPRLGQNKQGNPSRLTEPKGALHVPGEKHRFHGRAVGLKLDQEMTKLPVDAEKTLGEWKACRRRDHAEADCVETILPLFDNSVPCGRRPRIDA